MTIKVSLRPIIKGINLPTVLKTAILPNDNFETLFIATQIGEILYIRNGNLYTFLDIRSRIINRNGYSERGLLGLAFHPEFHNNGLFYLHYSVFGTEGKEVPTKYPNPCDSETLNLKWIDRETQFDHIDTIEEWNIGADGVPGKVRTLLNLKRPFSNHNGVNSLNFSPETNRLILTTGDGGSGYDPFNLSQDDMEIAGKIIEIDITKNIFTDNPPAVTRFDELPKPFQETLTLIAKGVRNISGISFQKFNNMYIKYIGNVGQDLVESIFSFVNYRPIPVTKLIDYSLANTEDIQEGFINFGWRAWEGNLPTSIIRNCPESKDKNEKIVVYYDETIKIHPILPLTSYFHEDKRPNKFEGIALTGVHPYMGSDFPSLNGKVVFCDLANKNKSPAKGVLAYTNIQLNCKLNDYNIIEVDYDFGLSPAYYVSMGTNQYQTKLFLGVYNTTNASDFNQGSVYEIIP